MLKFEMSKFFQIFIISLLVLFFISICGCLSDDACDVIPCDEIKPLFDAYMYKTYLLDQGRYPDSREGKSVYMANIGVTIGKFRDDMDKLASKSGITAIIGMCKNPPLDKCFEEYMYHEKFPKKSEIEKIPRRTIESLSIIP